MVFGYPCGFLQGRVTVLPRLLVVGQLLRLVILVFRRMSRTSWGCVTLSCRLLVIVRSLRLVILFFKECLKLRGGVLLFVVGCWLLCDHYVWSYSFSTPPYLYCLKFCLLFMHSALLVAMVSWLLAGLLGLYKKKIFPFSYFLMISLLSDVLCFVAVREVPHLGLF